MMTSLGIELVQLSIEEGRMEANLAKMLAAIARADTAGGTRLLVFPETALCGFPEPGNIASLARSLDDPLIGRLREAARAAQVAIAFGFAERDASRFYNTAVLVDAAGDLLLRYRKTHLWSADRGVFTPGEDFTVCSFAGRTVGLLICFDIEFPEPARALARLGADLLVVTNGNMDPYGPVHRRAIAARTQENQLFAVTANRCGAGAGLTFVGESGAWDPTGEALCVFGPGEAQRQVVIDWGGLERARRDYHYVREARVGLALEPAARGLVIPASGSAPSKR